MIFIFLKEKDKNAVSRFLKNKAKENVKVGPFLGCKRPFWKMKGLLTNHECNGFRLYIFILFFNKNIQTKRSLSGRPIFFIGLDHWG